MALFCHVCIDCKCQLCYDNISKVFALQRFKFTMFTIMKGTIVTNAYDVNPAQRYKVKRMTDEFARLGVTIDVISNDVFACSVVDGKAVCNLDTDFVLFFDKDKYTSNLIEKCGIRVFNSASATAICDDKMLTHIALSDNGIPMPDTLPGALCYTSDGEVSADYLNRAIDKLGLPMVVKQCYGSFGEQVYLANTYDELYEIVNSVKMSAYLLQRFEKQSAGLDMRVIVIGGKVVCGMLRKSLTDFRSNVAHGGQATAVDVPQDILTLCEKTAKVIGLDYCGIDVLLGDVPKVCEVNSNAMFTAIEQTTGVNVAEVYAKHIVECVKNGK